MGYGDDHHPDLAHPLQHQRSTQRVVPLKEEDVHMPGPKETEVHCDDCQGGYANCYCFDGKKKLEKPVVDNEFKDTNPKDAVGIKKGPISTVSGPVIAELGVAMLEGARKYGRHNYRVSGVRASVYRDAAWRHLAKWWAGQDIDLDSGLNHITKALASLMVLRDAMLFDKCIDDRPPALPDSHEFWANIDKMSADLIKRYPNAKAPFTQIGLNLEKTDDENSI